MKISTYSNDSVFPKQMGSSFLEQRESDATLIDGPGDSARRPLFDMWQSVQDQLLPSPDEQRSSTSITAATPTPKHKSKSSRVILS